MSIQKLKTVASSEETSGDSTVLAWKSNSINKTKMTKSFIQEAVKNLKKSGVKPKLITSVSGFSVFKFTFAYVDTYLLTEVGGDPYKPIGALNTLFGSIDARAHSVENVALTKEYIGRGLGLLLYEVVLSKVKVLVSSETLSQGSSKTWQKLIEKYNGVLVVPKNSIGTKGAESRIELPVIGWVTVKGIVYPKVRSIDGKITDLYKLLKSDNPLEAKIAKNTYYRIAV